MRPTHRRPLTSPSKSELLPVVYLSFDVETNGPVPGLFSMLSIGLCAFDYLGRIVWEYTANLLPLPDAQEDEVTMAWWHSPEQQAAWEQLMQNRRDPQEVFDELVTALKPLKERYRVFCVAWPACFDWMFLQWYMYKFVGHNPLGRTAKCGVTYCWALAKTSNPNIDMSAMLEDWKDPRFAHTHCALDDAREQGARFINMLREATRHGHDPRLLK